MNQTGSQAGSSPASDESSIRIIIASGGIGAIWFGLADLLNNHDAAAVIKLGEALKPIAPSWLANRGVAFIILTLLGCNPPGCVHARLFRIRRFDRRQPL